MNQFVPDWSTMGDLSRPLGEDDDLVELMWCNGHVVMQSQSHRPKLPPAQRAPEKASPPAVAPQEDEAGLWFPFALADSLDKDIFSELFYEAPVPVPVAATGAGAGVDGGKPGRDAVPVVDERRGGASAVTEAPRDLMPPPRSTHASGSRQQTMSLADAGGLSDLVRERTHGSAPGKAAAAAEAGASSSTLSAIGPSVCGSNQVQVQRAAEQCRAGRASDTAGSGALPSAVGSANAIANTSGRGHETTVASSSGRQSSYRFGATTTTTTTTTITTGTEPTSTSNLSSKRKRLDTTTEDYSESPSEDAESESAALARKPPQKLSSARRSRAAEVHNLSERRRRDRINEKMRALQELIPHCNKTDKASMLDEAIEYLKTLQMQMMWMGGGMAPPVMFPGVHQYLPRMGVGMGAAAAMPRMAPFMAAAQPVVPASAAVNAIPMGHAGPPAYRGHMPGVSMPDPYAHYLGVNHLQPQPGPSQHYAQGMSYYPLGAKAVQQNPTLHMAGGSMPAAAATTPAPLPSEHQPNIRSG